MMSLVVDANRSKAANNVEETVTVTSVATVAAGVNGEVMVKDQNVPSEPKAKVMKEEKLVQQPQHSYNLRSSVRKKDANNNSSSCSNANIVDSNASKATGAKQQIGATAATAGTMVKGAEKKPQQQQQQSELHTTDEEVAEEVRGNGGALKRGYDYVDAIDGENEDDVVRISTSSMSMMSGRKSPPKKPKFLVTYREMTEFFNLLKQDSINEFLKRDACCLISDKYALAMVFTYFKRAKLSLDEFTCYNFYLALYLASDIEEDVDEYKYEIFPWALGSKWRMKFSGFLRKRDALLRRIGYRAIVSRKCCEEVMNFVPDHYAWKRERSEDHGGATRAYLINRSRRYLSSKNNLDEEELNLPRGPTEKARPCPLCLINRSSVNINFGKYISPANPSLRSMPPFIATSANLPATASSQNVLVPQTHHNFQKQHQSLLMPLAAHHPHLLMQQQQQLHHHQMAAYHHHHHHQHQHNQQQQQQQHQLKSAEIYEHCLDHENDEKLVESSETTTLTGADTSTLFASSTLDDTSLRNGMAKLDNNNNNKKELGNAKETKLIKTPQKSLLSSSDETAAASTNAATAGDNAASLLTVNININFNGQTTVLPGSQQPNAVGTAAPVANNNNSNTVNSSTVANTSVVKDDETAVSSSNSSSKDFSVQKLPSANKFLRNKSAVNEFDINNNNVIIPLSPKPVSTLSKLHAGIKCPSLASVNYLYVKDQVTTSDEYDDDDSDEEADDRDTTDDEDDSDDDGVDEVFEKTTSLGGVGGVGGGGGKMSSSRKHEHLANRLNTRRAALKHHAANGAHLHHYHHHHHHHKKRLNFSLSASAALSLTSSSMDSTTSGVATANAVESSNNNTLLAISQPISVAVQLNDQLVPRDFMPK